MAAKKKAQTTDYDEVKNLITPVHSLERYMSALIYGRSGTGKTVFAGTFPKPLLLLDIKEKGTDSIANVEGVDVIAITSWEQIEQVYWYIKSGKSGYKTVVLDGGSQMQDLGMSHVKDDPTAPMSKRLWGELSGLLKTWMFNYRDLMEDGIHVVFIAHERSNDGESIEDQIDPTIGPRFMPSLAGALCGGVSFIGNTFIREKFIGKGDERVRQVEYGMRVGPHAFYTTKIRKPPESDAVDVIINPTFEKVMAASRGESVAPKRSIKRRKENAEASQAE